MILEEEVQRFSEEERPERQVVEGVRAARLIVEEPCRALSPLRSTLFTISNA